MPKPPQPLSPGEEGLARDLQAYKILAVREYQFNKARRWRADFFVFPNLLIEVEGGIWSRGRHSRGAGQEKDFEKSNAATLAGFRLLRFSTGQVFSGYAIDTVLEAVNQ